MATCSVSSCSNSSKKSNYRKGGITFHRYPKGVEQKNLWIYAACRDEGWTPSAFSVVCSKHFTDKDFVYLKDRRKLVENAIPTLNLPEVASETLQAVAEEMKSKYDFSGLYIKNLEKYLEDPADKPGIPLTIESSRPNKPVSAEVRAFKSQVLKGYQNKILKLKHQVIINADLIDKDKVIEPKKPRKNTKKFPLKHHPKEYFHIIKLSEEEMMNKRELDKSSEKYLSYTYRCDKCILGFDEEDLYERHIKDTHELAGKFVCHICDTRMSRPANFRLHVENHYRYFQCKKCDFGHHNDRMLITHARQHVRSEVRAKYGNPNKSGNKEPAKKYGIPILVGDLELDSCSQDSL